MGFNWGYWCYPSVMRCVLKFSEVVLIESAQGAFVRGGCHCHLADRWLEGRGDDGGLGESEHSPGCRSRQGGLVCERFFIGLRYWLRLITNQIDVLFNPGVSSSRTGCSFCLDTKRTKRSRLPEAIAAHRSLSTLHA
ncbi:hypothetical protein BC643_2502 [Mangrovibacterium diazotrophicum]|uniref:Uncharacterized protein n=1 Tax=Mangrovibacterium diazotrophicum TaxID=1261403 RepID=A0A419W9P5_9BACT|nr:hypothetical protein BC643_2502 [Mangrovibacterium diazotrophicum]